MPKTAAKSLTKKAGGALETSTKPARASRTQGPDALLAEALRQAEETRNVVEDALVGFGRWLLVHVFEGDAGAVLTGERRNAVWAELQRRAGGPSLRLSKRFLSVAVRIAAHDQRIQDDSWRLLEPGRKELLLPLAAGTDEAPLREAAQHVMAMKLSHRATKAYVRNQRSAVRTRVTALTHEQAKQDVARFSERVADARYEKRFAKLVAGLESDERAALREEITHVRAWAMRQLRVLAGAG